MEHIATPLGCVGLFLDGKPCAHDGVGEIVDTSDYARRHPVDGNWCIAYQHEPDGSSHTLECRLSPTCPCEGGPASGERMEAVEIEGNGAVLVIAVEDNSEELARDHGVSVDGYIAKERGLATIAELPASAKAQRIVFGVSWVNAATEQNRTNPWLVGDPGGDGIGASRN